MTGSAPRSSGGEAAPQDADGGRVVLEIGGSVGAAVILTPAESEGLEVEIRAVGTEWDGTHVAVHRRRPPTGPVHAALFPSLEEGHWEVRYRDDATGPTSTVEVAGGQVVTGALGLQA